jgi:hypothetical protein
MTICLMKRREKADMERMNEKSISEIGIKDKSILKKCRKCGIAFEDEKRYEIHKGVHEREKSKKKK